MVGQFHSIQEDSSPARQVFEGAEKKNKSGLKDAKPEYCAPMNIQ